MNELEAKLLGVDVDAVVARLRDLGARAGDRRLQRRYVYDVLPTDPNKWIRLRTNGSTTTLAVKTITSSAIDGVREVESTVEDFDSTAAVLAEMGLRPRGYQENWRTDFVLPAAAVSLDEWPGIPPYLEIEADTAARVISTAAELGFAESELTYGNTVQVYAGYGIDLLKIERLDTSWNNGLVHSDRGQG
jgi:adenylate cyclase, class 2